MKVFQIAALISFLLQVSANASYAAAGSMRQTTLNSATPQRRSHQTENIQYNVYRYMYRHMKCTGILTVYDAERPIPDSLLRRLKARHINAIRWSKAGSPMSDVSTVYLCAASIDKLRWINRTHVHVDVGGLYKNQKIWGDEAMKYNATLRIAYRYGNWQVLGTTHGWERNGE